MFDSGIKVKDLIAQIREEAEISYDVTDDSFVQWLNSVEQLLYSEVIREQKQYSFGIDSPQIKTKSESEGALHLICGFPKYDDEADMRFEDVHAVYVDGRQLIRTTLTSGAIFPDAYYKELDGMGVNLPSAPDEITVMYCVRPELKSKDLTGDETVKVPAEFIDLVTAKLRGEAYKLSNEDALAAKWLNDYNILLETFKAWVAGKQSSFGL